MLIKEGSAFFFLHSFDRMDGKGDAHEKIEFINTGSIDPIATISGQSLTIPKSTMIDEMQVGDKCWSWRVKDDKSLQLKWIG